MSLRARLAAIVLAILAGLAMLYAMIIAQVVQPGFERLEQAEADRDLLRVREILQHEIDDVDILAGDRADRDDTYAFVLDRNEAYRASHLVPTVFSRSRTHLLVILDRQGRIVWSGMIDPDDGRPLTLPLFSAKGLAPDHPLLRGGGHADPLAGLLMTPRGPLLLSVRPIRYSDQGGPSAGTLLMGRFLSTSVLDDLSRLAQLPLSVITLEVLQEENPPLAKQLDIEHPTALESLPNGGLRGNILISDLFGRPGLILRADLPHDLSDNARQLLRWSIDATGLSGVLILIVLLVVIGWAVVQPLGRMARHVAALHDTGDLSARLGPQSSEEMTALASAIDGLADQLEMTAHDRSLAQAVLLDGIHGIADGFVLWDENDRLVLCNDQYRACFPRVAEMIEPGVSFTEIATAALEADQFCPAEAPRAGSIAMRIEQHRNPSGPLEYLLADGRWLEIREQRTQDDGIVGIYTDITRRKLAEDQLRGMVQELERSNTDLEQFAYIASHDLQEPLRQISSYAQLIERRFAAKIDGDGREFIRYMIDGAKRMQDQIAGLLAYARLNRQDRVFITVDSGEALRAALTQLRAAIAAAGAQIQVGSLPAVVGDRTLIVQLFQNLVGNAVKYARPEMAPHISITAEQRDGFWQFAVADNGIGLEPSESELIFRIFHRLHGRDKYEGTGIGLAICKRIVEYHQGQIWVESVPGQGSIFLFTLPADVSADSEISG